MRYINRLFNLLTFIYLFAIPGGRPESGKIWSRDQQVHDDGRVGRAVGNSLSDRSRRHSQIFHPQRWHPHQGEHAENTRVVVVCCKIGDVVFENLQSEVKYER